MAWAAPGRMTRSSGRNKYVTSSLMVPSRSKNTAFSMFQNLSVRICKSCPMGSWHIIHETHNFRWASGPGPACMPTGSHPQSMPGLPEAQNSSLPAGRLQPPSGPPLYALHCRGSILTGIRRRLRPKAFRLTPLPFLLLHRVHRSADWWSCCSCASCSAIRNPEASQSCGDSLSAVHPSWHRPKLLPRTWPQRGLSFCNCWPDPW